MKFFIYVPGMTFDGNLFKQPGFSLGGSETMGYYVAHELAKQKHSVFIFCNLPGNQIPATIDGVNYIPIGQSSQMFPFGHNFEKIAMSIPCDVILGQRNPGLFAKNYNSKLNYWWTHDLALKRFQGHINAQIWNVDKLLAVSEFHRKQVSTVYGIEDESYTGILPNGIDLNLWNINQINPELKMKSKTLLYSHRPERGLINLVQPGGIMDQLLKVDPEIKLLVCGYDNTTPEMIDLYNFLYSRCEELPNVQNIGHLDKQTLARHQSKVWLHVYPTDFEETSCITMMEEQAAGTPILATKVGALTETLKNAGVYWCEKQAFAKQIKYLLDNPGRWMSLHKSALEKRESYSIDKVVNGFLSMVDSDFENKTKNKQRLFKHLFHTSDIYAANILADRCNLDKSCIENRFHTITNDLGQTVEFYEKSERRNTEIGNKHGMDHLDSLLHMQRLQPVIENLKRLPYNATVLDYGCCVGQVSFALKKVFPEMKFHCVDISAEQVAVGEKYAMYNKIQGVTFQTIKSPDELFNECGSIQHEFGGHVFHESQYDAIICLEVLEHIWDYKTFLANLTKLVKTDGRVILSTPLGPFDENSDDPDPLYQHLHNFEELDIWNIAGHKPGFDIVYIMEAYSKRGESLGNYVWMWTEDHKEPLKEIDYDRKLKVQKPRQTVTACMICGPDSPVIEKCLRSIKYFVDDIIIGVDDPEWLREYDTTVLPDKMGSTMLVGQRYKAQMFPIESPLQQGFAGARNDTIKKAEGDWVLWIDDDEALMWPEQLGKYMRDNIFDSYGVSQHHISADPPGILKTDHPSRIFRNNKGIRFFGIVHEHPEKAINKGAGRTFLLADKQGVIMHNAYDTEETRRRRFIRNFPLMERDRIENPERKLGMFLWIRDLAHRNRFEFEQTGAVSPEMLKRAREAVNLWRLCMLDVDANIRMFAETAPYITECIDITMQGGGLTFRLALDANNKGLGDSLNTPINPTFVGKVENKQDLIALFNILVKEKVETFETVTYF